MARSANMTAKNPHFDRTEPLAAAALARSSGHARQYNEPYLEVVADSHYQGMGQSRCNIS
jgi:hypothetical protein